MKVRGIVVANSRKNNGRCVVCYDIENKKFIRLISKEKREDNELEVNECKYSNGAEIRIRDEVLFCVLDENPNNSIQPENKYLDTRYGFKLISKHNAIEAEKILKNVTDVCNYIFFNNDFKILKKEKMEQSFVICLVKKLKFYSVIKNNGINDYQKCNCSFYYKNVFYKDISVTINKTKNKDIEEYDGKEYTEALVGFSIGNKYKDNYHYKFLCSFIGYRKEE